MGAGEVLGIKLEGKKFKAGDQVRGVLTAAGDPGKVREMAVQLVYADRSPNFTWPEVHAESAVPDGFSSGDRHEFSLDLPETALPAQAGEKGELWWEVRAKADVKRARDHKVQVPLEVTPAKGLSTAQASPALSRGTFGNNRKPVEVEGPDPQPRRWESKAGFLAKRLSVNQNWDVAHAIDTGVVRRGEEIGISVEIENPREGRDFIQVDLLCSEHYMFETTTSDFDSSASHKMTYTESVVAFEASAAPLDPSVGSHTLKMKVPKNAPFSYAGENLAFLWNVVIHRANEDPLPRRYLPFWVFP